ncbi:MAG: peptidoglycan-binding protein [Firmicutes bacterium]|nr:peptidoglycan-binding protein [Bacillota bacterium]
MLLVMFTCVILAMLAAGPGWAAPQTALPGTAKQPAATAALNAVSPQGDAIATEQAPLASVPTVEDIWQVQAVLSALGYYERSLSGAFDSATREALERLQRRYGLSPTGVLDSETWALLGGPATELERMPRFLYTVRAGDTLSSLAARFGVPIPRILRFNPSITAVDRIYAGHQLIIPVDFPVPADFRVLRIQVLPDRFLGSYFVDVSFAAADRLAEELAQRLRERGFDVTLDPARPLDGITVRNASVELGRITFSAYRSEGWTRVDVGLLAAGSASPDPQSATNL